MQDIGFATLILPGGAASQVQLLTASLREFGGHLANAPLWAFVPQSLDKFSPYETAALRAQQIDIIPFPIDEALVQFPFAAKVIAAAAAESIAVNAVERLVFFDRDTLILREPVDLLIPDPVALGYRPVHHRLIGAPWGEPPDAFWQMIYDYFEVPESHLFPMTTHVGEEIYPYYNCGTFVTRPSLGLMSRWAEEFQQYYRQAEIKAYYRVDPKYAIFIHQVIFTAVMLAELGIEQVRELNPAYNYPLHLHADIPPELQAASTTDLVTARFEDIFETGDWQEHPTLDEATIAWLSEQSNAT